MGSQLNKSTLLDFCFFLILLWIKWWNLHSTFWGSQRTSSSKNWKDKNKINFNFKLKPEDLYVQKLNGDVIYSPPAEKKYKPSQCTPLFMNAYLMRNAGAVIHTHSKNCVMATLFYSGTTFRITHQEMIKGIRKCTTGIQNS